MASDRATRLPRAPHDRPHFVCRSARRAKRAFPYPDMPCRNSRATGFAYAFAQHERRRLRVTPCEPARSRRALVRRLRAEPAESRSVCADAPYTAPEPISATAGKSAKLGRHRRRRGARSLEPELAATCDVHSTR